MDRPVVGIMAQDNGIVPAIHGGAVETLLTMLIEENEKRCLCNLIIFVTYDKQAAIYSAKYKFTKFIFIRSNYVRRLLYKLLRSFYKFSGKHHTGVSNDFVHQTMKCVYLREKLGEKFDCFLVEEGFLFNGIKAFVDLFGDRVVYHSHLHEVPVHGSIWPNVISISEFCRKEWLSVPSDTKNVFVLRNGIDLGKFSKRISVEERLSLREKLGIAEDDIVVIYVGRIIPVKGVKELLLAIDLLQNKSIKLVLAGSSSFAQGKMTPYLKEVRSLIDKMENQAIHVGYIDNDVLYKYYQIADMQAVPSMCEEAAGLVAIEGMASGLPLVVTRSGGMVEYVDEKCALVVDKEKNVEINLSEAIQVLAGDAALRKRMGAHGMERSKLFSKESFYMNFVDIIKNVVHFGGADRNFVYWQWKTAFAPDFFEVAA